MRRRVKKLNSYVVSEESVQLCYEVETGTKKKGNKAVGIDTGINTLAALSTGEMIGRRVGERIARIRNSKNGSKGQQRAILALRNYIDCTVKRIASHPNEDVVVVEDLHQLGHGTRQERRLSKKVRSSLGKSNWSYWLKRLEMACERHGESFRRVAPAFTSQRCFSCGHTEGGNRNGTTFRCLNCGYADHADLNAALNIVSRFLGGTYGSACKALKGRLFRAAYQVRPTPD